MGYFSRLDCSVQLGEAPSPPASRKPEPASVPTRPASVDAAAPAAKPAAEQITSHEINPAATPAEKPTAPAAASEKLSPSTALHLDGPAPEDDTAARKAHEETEAKRKAKWDADQREKRAAEQSRLNRLAAMSDEDVVAASTQRVSAETERLTRRNMKDCVSQHVQNLCRQDPAFARKTMHPRKSMVNCFRYINRKAQEFVRKEMEDNGVQAEAGVYGDDVPDDIVYQWAVDYFNDPNAQEDGGREEKFTPRPYVPKTGSKTAKPKVKKETPKQAAPKPKPQAGVDGQLSLLGATG